MNWKLWPVALSVLLCTIPVDTNWCCADEGKNGGRTSKQHESQAEHAQSAKHEDDKEKAEQVKEEQRKKIPRENAVAAARMWSRLNGKWFFLYLSDDYQVLRRLDVEFATKMETAYFYETCDADELPSKTAGVFRVDVTSQSFDNPINFEILFHEGELGWKEKRVVVVTTEKISGVELGFAFDAKSLQQARPMKLQTTVVLPRGKSCDWLRNGTTIQLLRKP